MLDPPVHPLEPTVRAVRLLCVDMVEEARSGHPGAPLGLAPLAVTLFAQALRFDPEQPDWPDRDRFVLSCGHASALLYALLHLSGYDLPLSELRRFRQLGSRTPGHPEARLTPGVETTTGPLGQGLATAVGMALAGRHLAARFNRPGYPLFTYRVFVFASDGDLMEGISHEAASFAGHHRLENLTVFWDDNQITIDGPTSLTWSEDVLFRFRSYGWKTLELEDGNDLNRLHEVVQEAQQERSQPLLVRVRTVIGYGSPKAGTAAVHGAPLGPEAAQATREFFGAGSTPPFTVSESERAPLLEAAARGKVAARLWREQLERYSVDHPALAAELERRLHRTLPEGWEKRLPRFEVGKAMATRAASGKVLAQLAPGIPELVGGSADLSESNQTAWPGSEPLSPSNPRGRYFHFGVREHAMAAALNGLALSELVRPFGGTFLVFSDYLRPALRLSALMGLPVLYLFTHDSIFLGEDGPTHQPVEHLAALRAIPNLWVFRPADANETAAAWQVALRRTDGPTALVLTRQAVPNLAETAELAAAGVARGGYVLRDARNPEKLDLLVLATGSEVALALEVAVRLEGRGFQTRVVSLPCWELFSAQEPEYRNQVLPLQVQRRVALEAATPFGWERWVGPHGLILGLNRFGASGPASALGTAFGFSVEAIEARILETWVEVVDVVENC
jgi:transketolase